MAGSGASTGETGGGAYEALPSLHWLDRPTEYAEEENLGEVTPPDTAERIAAELGHRAELRGQGQDAARRYWTTTRRLFGEEAGVRNAWIDLGLSMTLDRLINAWHLYHDEESLGPSLLFAAYGDITPDGIPFGPLPFIFAEQRCRMGFLGDPLAGFDEETTERFVRIYPGFRFPTMSPADFQGSAPPMRPNFVVLQNAPPPADSGLEQLVDTGSTLDGLLSLVSAGGYVIIPGSPSFAGYHSLARAGQGARYLVYEFPNAVVPASNPTELYLDRPNPLQPQTMTIFKKLEPSGPLRPYV